EVRMTVIATGFADKEETVGVGGKVVDLPRPSRSLPSSAPVPVAPWRRKFADPRGEASEEALGEAADLEVPAFLRRQAELGHRAGWQVVARWVCTQRSW